MTVWSSTDQEVGGFVNDNPFMAQMILTFSTNNNGVLKSAFDQEMRDLHADFRSKTDKCAKGASSTRTGQRKSCSMKESWRS